MIDENRIKHLEFLQAAIQRLAGNSFAYRGWAVTLVGAVLAFSHQSAIPVTSGYVAIVAFWILDAYSLSTERAFRRLYDDARRGKVEVFDMAVPASCRSIKEVVRAGVGVHSFIFYVLLLCSLLVLGG